MGDDHNIVLDDLAMAAIASGENGADTLAHMKALLDQTTPEELDQRIAEMKAKHDEQHAEGHSHDVHHHDE